jgi:hypothetical protein
MTIARQCAEPIVSLDRFWAQSGNYLKSGQSWRSTISCCVACSVSGLTTRSRQRFDRALLLQFFFFGIRGTETVFSRSDQVVKLTKGEVLMVNIGSTSTGGKVSRGQKLDDHARAC